MGKKAREQRAAAIAMNSKSTQERKDEMDIIRGKLENLGLSTQQEGMTEVTAIIDTFIATGESITCHIKLPGTQRVCMMKLANRKTSESIVNLAFRSGV